MRPITQLAMVSLKQIYNRIKSYLSPRILLLLSVLLFGVLNFQQDKMVDGEGVGEAVPDAKWVIIGDNERFSGYETKNDPSKVASGANPQGQNTSINNGDRISIRDEGYQIFPENGTESVTSAPVHSLKNFRRRDGENLMVRGQGTSLEWYDEYQNDWENLNSGYSTGTEFGFAEYNINTDQRSYVYFGNGVEPFSRWTGAHTNISVALAGGEATINAIDTTGFTATGTIRVCGTDVTYTGVTSTAFTGAAGTPACAANRGITQAVQTYASNPKGNIYLVANNRLFIAGVTSTPQAVFFSQYGDATSFVTSSLVTDTTAESSGIFNLAEGGGGVTAMAQDEGSIYIFKRTIIYKATLSDSLYTLQPLKPFDGKSKTTGAISQKSTFAGGNGIFFITPDNQIMNLARIESYDYPQINAISDSIKPTIDTAIFTSSTGIFYKDKAYFSAKSDSNSTANDVVFVYNFPLQAWESPVVGWPVSDWAIYSDGGLERLYFGHSINPNTYLVIPEALDNGLGVAANWRSKQFDFDIPQSLKEIDNVFVEGYLTENTNLTISLLLDENGNKQIFSTEFSGDETTYLYDSPEYNVFGFEPFGVERFGSNQADDGRTKFRVYLNKDLRRVPFYTAQIEFASDGEAQSWEIDRFGFLVRESSQPEDRTIYRSFR